MQVGTADFAGGAVGVFQSVTFDVAFEEAPVLLLQVQTNNGAEWEIVRARDVTTTGFKFAIQEVESTDGFHTAEVVGWASLDASAADGTLDWSGIGAQAFSTGRIVGDERADFMLDTGVGVDPLIAASMSTFEGSNPATLRLADVTPDGSAATANFVALEDQSADAEIDHVAEEVTGIAFADNGVLSGFEYLTVDTMFMA